METNQYGLYLLFSLIAILGLISFTLCFTSEFTKSKKKDVRLDGNICYVGESEAFDLGIGAIICLSMAQLMGNMIICRKTCSRVSSCIGTMATIFMTISWVSFGGAIIIIGGATSMNRKQAFGEGWLDGECYIVKDGVYIASSILILFTVTLTLISGLISTRKIQVKQDKRISCTISIKGLCLSAKNVSILCIGSF